MLRVFLLSSSTLEQSMMHYFLQLRNCSFPRRLFHLLRDWFHFIYFMHFFSDFDTISHLLLEYMSQSNPREVDNLTILYNGSSLDLATLRLYLASPGHPLHISSADVSVQTDPIHSQQHEKAIRSLKVLSIRDFLSDHLLRDLSWSSDSWPINKIRRGTHFTPGQDRAVQPWLY